MQLPPDLAEALRHMTYRAEPASDLIVTAERLMAAAAAGVPSLIAVAVTIPTPTVVTLTVTTPGRGDRLARESLDVVLPGTDGASLHLYAGQAGALTQLAADLAVLLDIHRGSVHLTALAPHLMPRPEHELTAALEDASATQQALGVLLDRGWLPAEATGELGRRAVEADVTPAQQARRIVDEVVRPGGEACV